MLNELYNYLLEAYTDEEALNLLAQIHRMSKYSLESFITNKCEELNLCPECFKELGIKIVKEDRGEFWGFPCTEDVAYKYCECGYED